jgi:hypothetical protein
MALSPRLLWRKWRLRKQAVEPDGKPLTDGEGRLLGQAADALADKEATRRLAHFEEGAELLLAHENHGECQ